MSDYIAENIRNLALVGHGGAGKTQLVEALLAASGKIPVPGSVIKGTTVCDFGPIEKELQHSLDVAITHLTHQDTRVHLIDTPGSPDFLGRSLAVLPAVETAAIVINARMGIESLSLRMMKAADNRNLCRAVIINQIDAPDTDLATLLAQVRETFGAECLPLNLPADGGTRVVDCFFDPSDEPTDFSSVAEAYRQIVDQVVELDEDLMETYLEQGQELNAGQLHHTFEAALREAHLIPVCFVSAQTGVGVPELLNILVQLMPNPAEGNPPPFMKVTDGQQQPIQVVPDPERHAIAHVFKVSNDPYRGKLGIFRIHQGRITPASQLFIGDHRKPFKVSHLYRLNGAELEEVEEGLPGDILCVARVEDLHFDAVLHDSHDEDELQLSTVECPVPLFGLAIVPTRHGDEQKLADALQRLQGEDPCFRVEHNASANETVIRGLGELHLKVVMRRLSEQFHLDVDAHTPSIPYRETITASAEGHCRHKKQTGGAGQFAEVFLRVAPRSRGAGFAFVNAVVGGAIPGNFIPAIEKGVRQILDEGVIAGYPLCDLEVTVFDGKFHPVDSKEIAFITAGRKAFIEAVQAATPILLEPIARIRIRAPGSAVGDLTSDLAGRGGRIHDTQARAHGQILILGEVPLAALEGYESRLKSLTAGEGVYLLEFSHYAPVSARVQEQLIADAKPTTE